MARHVETIRVRGGADVDVDVVETERGPLVLDGLSVRFPARVASDVGFSCLLPLLRSRSAQDVIDALRGWVDPVNRVLTADADGTVLSVDAGLVVTRSPQDRRLPHDAWSEAARPTAWHPLAEPAPVLGVAVDANEKPAAASRDHGRAYVAPYRARRIRDLLDAGSASAPADMATIHGDTLLGSADELLGLGASGRRAVTGGRGAARPPARVGPAHGRRAAPTPGLSPPGGPRSPRCSPLIRPSRRCTPRTAGVPCSTSGWASDRGWPTRCRGSWAPLRSGSTVWPWRAKRWSGSAVGRRRQRPWGDRHRLQPVPTLLGYPGPAVEAVPLSGDTDCVRCTASVPGVSDRSWRGSVARWVWDLGDRRRSRWGCRSGRPETRRARTRPTSWRRGRRPRPSRSSPTGTCSRRRRRERDPRRRSARRRRGRAVRSTGSACSRSASSTPTRDLDTIHAWVTAPGTGFWGLAELSREELRDTYAFVDSLPTHHAYLLRCDGEPVALLQVYDPADDPLGECYDVQPGDVGIHLLVGARVRPGSSRSPVRRARRVPARPAGRPPHRRRARRSQRPRPRPA